MRFPRFSPAAVKPLKDDLVVLLHGFGGHRIQMLPIATAISRQHSVVNYGYKTRNLLLHEHAESLLDAIHTRVKHAPPSQVHFVTHSFGGVVLRTAFGLGLRELLPSASRCALIAPPLRGAALARTLEEMDFRGPEVVRRALRGTTRVIMGAQTGKQLRTYGPEWFEKTGEFPRDATMLVVEGIVNPIINPMIEGESDGIVGACETMMDLPHYRLRLSLTHNVLLMSPAVITNVVKFVDGEPVGDLHPGKPLLSS